MTNPYRDMCAELVDAWASGKSLASSIVRARALLAQPVAEGPTDQELLRCAKIATPCYNLKVWERELNMMRAAIAADRARALLDQPVPEEPSDDKLMDIARATNLVYYMGKGCGFASPYMEETDITAEVLVFARAVLAKWGCQ